MRNKTEDIVFVINPSLWSQSMYPSGILCLSSYLESRGFNNIILDSKISLQKIADIQNEKLVLDRIKEMRPKVVCFSSSHKEFAEVLRMNNAIRQMEQNIFTIVGGSQATYRPIDFLNNGFDFVCVREGELTLYEFVKEVFDKSNRWQDIRGLYWKSKGINIFNQPRALLKEKEMNSVVNLAYEKIDRRYFDINVDIVRGLPLRGALLLTTRGCPFSCSYCGCNLIFGREMRFKAFENIEREIKYLKEHYDIEGIWIVDDTFTIKEEHVIGVCKILKKYSIIWACQSRVDTINEKLIKIMKDSGCVQIDFGVESGSQRILDEVIGKKTNITQIIQAFDWTKKYKIRTLANFMLGFPTETYQEFKQTEEIADLIAADVYIFSIATPLPGTRLYEMINTEISPHEYSLLDWNGGLLTEQLNKSEIKNLIQERLRLHRKYFFNSMVKSVLTWQNYKFFIKRKYKFRRLLFIIRFLVNTCFRQVCVLTGYKVFLS